NISMVTAGPWVPPPEFSAPGVPLTSNPLMIIPVLPPLDCQLAPSLLSVPTSISSSEGPLPSGSVGQGSASSNRTLSTRLPSASTSQSNSPPLLSPPATH